MRIFYSASAKGFFNSILNPVIPQDAVEISSAYHRELLDGEQSGKIITQGQNGYPVLAEKEYSFTEQVVLYENAVQRHLDAKAEEFNYDNMWTAVTYAEEPAVPKFQNDGRALRAWRSLVWQKCYEILAEVNNNVRPAPTLEELIAELPEFSME